MLTIQQVRYLDQLSRCHCEKCKIYYEKSEKEFEQEYLDRTNNLVENIEKTLI